MRGNPQTDEVVGTWNGFTRMMVVETLRNPLRYHVRSIQPQEWFWQYPCQEDEMNLTKESLLAAARQQQENELRERSVRCCICRGPAVRKCLGCCFPFCEAHAKEHETSKAPRFVAL